MHIRSAANSACHRDRGGDTSARPQCELLRPRALQISETTLGPHHPDVAIYLVDLGRVLRDQGNPAEVRAHFQRALVIFEEHLGTEHPSTAATRRALQSHDT